MLGAENLKQEIKVNRLSHFQRNWHVQFHKETNNLTQNCCYGQQTTGMLISERPRLDKGYLATESGVTSFA